MSEEKTTKKIEYEGRWIEQTDSIIEVYGTDWKAPFVPRIKIQIIKDSPVSQIVFEAFNREKPKLSKVLAYIKLANAQFRTLAAVALLTAQRATGRSLSSILTDMFEEIRARDSSVSFLCPHCAKDLTSGSGISTTQKPWWQR